MDKYEYKVRSEEISKLIDKEKYAEAVKIADTIDWRRVKSAAMLLKIAALYRVSRRNEDSREMLMLAYERYPTNRSVVYSLCELSIELDDVVAAIEYYKQFAKLAPKDNGVYTLRYRILEAQEASLEERIDILEELKKKDYQEEWAYELAYLYHRIGLSTKCVEECDDIILWFGDGPYVMKAMELKAKHVPLTAIQQQNYDIMLGNAGQNYSSGSYDNENYEDQNYNSGDYNGENYDGQDYDTQYYDPQSYSGENYGGQSYNEENYAGQNYDTEGYDGQNYNAESYDGQNYEANGYNDGNYADQNYEANGYNDGNYADQNYEAAGYDDGNYDGQNYEAAGYDDGNYDGRNQEANGYDNGNYSDQNYESGNYSNGNYDAGNYDSQGYDTTGYDETNYNQVNDSNESYGNEEYHYPDGQYADENYGQNNFVDDGYGNLSYVDSSYPDNGYTGEFYVEQTYDENGNPVNPEMYADSEYPQESYGYSQNESVQDNSYAGQANAPKEYRNGLHLVEGTNAAAAAGNSSDMSQYNTINLQKVVAESMKELFPDDDEDVFAEDRGKYNSAEDIGNITGDTRIFAGVGNPDGTPGFQTTGRVRIAQMVTGVSEAVPEPHTGAIKKVLVPGDDALLIKSESDLDELRDITEKTVDDEHSRMEDNDENVYHEQSILDMDETDEASASQPTGSMKLDNVLVEWERMKQDNAKKHQEEIKKRVLTQTGKIFADFNNSIKSGILGELEREEEEAQKSSQAKGSARQGGSSGDGFLEADVTGDIPQKPESDDDFDVTYVTEQTHSAHMQETGQPAEPVQPEISRAGKPTDYEAGGYEQDMTAESPEPYEAGSYAAETGEEPGYGTDERTQEIVAEGIENYSSTSTDKYMEEPYTEEYPEEAYAGNDAEYLKEAQVEEIAEYPEKAYTEDVSEYSEEAYMENIGDYPEEAYAGGTAEYPEEAYTEGSADYPEEAYAEESADYPEETYAEEAGYPEDTYAKEAADYPEETYAEEAGYPEDTYAEEAADYPEAGYADETGRYTQRLYDENINSAYPDENGYRQETARGYANTPYTEDNYDDLEDAYSEASEDNEQSNRRQNYQYNERELDPEDAESIAEMAKEDALKTQEIKMNTADLSSLSEKIVATTKKEARGAKREELREFTPEEQTLFENFAVTKKIKKQIIYALENMTLAPYIGNVIITGDAGLDTVRMAKNLVKEYQASDESFSGKLAKITGEKINQRNIKDVFEKLNNGGIIIEKANGMSEEKLYEMALCLTQENLAIVVIMEDTKKEITKLLEKQAMIVDYFNIRIDLMEMDNNALVAYAKNYALALEYSIDELGTLALYTRIANMQSGNHVVTKDEVRDIIDEAIWKSKKSKIKNFVDVLFARRYDNEDMIVLKERDFM